MIRPAVRQTTGGSPASSTEVMWRAAVIALAGGAALGASWWALAPVVRARLPAGGVSLGGNQELQVAQDGWLAVLLAVAGVLVATVQAVRLRERPVRRLLVAAVATGFAGFVAWQVGQWLGSASVGSQVAAGATRALTPLQLHTGAVLLVGPLMFAVTRCLAALFSAARR